MVHPLEYSFIHMGVGGIIPPGIRKSFYFDQVLVTLSDCLCYDYVTQNLFTGSQEYPDVCFRMLDFDQWSHPVAVRTIKNEVICLESKSMAVTSEKKVLAFLLCLLKST